MAPNGSEWLQIASNGSKWLQMAPNRSKLLQMNTNDSECLQLAPNCSKRLQIAQNGSKWLRMAPNCSKWLRMSPNGKVGQVGKGENLEKQDNQIQLDGLIPGSIWFLFYIKCVFQMLGEQHKARHSKCLNHHNQRLCKFLFDWRKVGAPNIWCFVIIFFVDTLKCCSNSFETVLTNVE